MRLLLVRHAQTPANVEGVLATDRPGPGLTGHGHEQAAELVPALADEPIRSISVSPLTRTSLTAAPLAAALGLDPVVREGLEEIAAGDLEGLRDRASVERYLGVLRSWGEGELDVRMPGSESGSEFFARFDAAIGQISAEHDPVDTVAVVSHGAAIRVWCGGRCANIEPEFVRRNDLHNTGVVVVEGDPSAGWRALSWMGEPPGGRDLDDRRAVDPTGEEF